MTKAGRSTFAVAVSSLLLLSLPELTYAQQQVAYGTWEGYATYTETDYDQMGNVIGVYSTSGLSALNVGIFNNTFGSLEYFSGTVSGPLGFSGPLGVTLGGQYSDYNYSVFSFGPTSASGGDFAGGYAGFDGYFDVTYQSILPDGEMDTRGGFAVAQYSGNTDLGYESPYIAWSASFTSVPEPSSIVPMAIGAVVVATWVVIRRRSGSSKNLSASEMKRSDEVWRDSPVP